MVQKIYVRVNYIEYTCKLKKVTCCAMKVKLSFMSRIDTPIKISVGVNLFVKVAFVLDIELWEEQIHFCS